MADLPGNLPADYLEWQPAIEKRNLVGKTVHAAELASTSKMAYAQFLLLRVLWKVNKLLSGDHSWAAYCHSIKNAEITVGSFAIAGIAKSNPTKGPDDDDSVVQEESESESEVSSEPVTPAAQVPEELHKLMFLPTKDEQIVNTALVVFLNSLLVPFGVKRCDWTLHRKAFSAHFEAAGFEARTDGYLDDGNVNPWALIEVNPVTRKDKNQVQVQIQESSQMSGCIKNDIDAPPDKLRVHMSQNRHEIFFTIAKYDSGYVSYLKKKPADDQPPSFLTMHQYGPWNTENAGHMKKLGPILLALALYAEAEVKKAEDRRRLSSNMASANGTCATCGKQTDNRCSRCNESPDTKTGDTGSIFCCTKVCQAEHWSVHRAECKVRVQRKKLLRTAAILKAAFLTYRALRFDVGLWKIELRGNTLYLYNKQKGLMVAPKIGPFPEYLTTDDEHREAAPS
ncbi:zinc finger MYND domain-containing protein [Aspergillus affinis]|uniref:zinc finger MYND domain-containing protein n=1 Tax=Aspergillus affinis TaxID=1070780 RepID=UPI0022FF2027|nr:uncharacterized protein KD926_000304 [Aspergillus affinis]KAI9037509.1 hypothetical protein KD926_000304 [Aspergillus affinis]